MKIISDINRQNYYSVYYDENLFGFYCFTRDKDEIEIGLGLNPRYVSKGFGERFVMACLSFTNQPESLLTLGVVSFNHRAITVYERCGFVKHSVFMNPTNGSEYEFIRMSRISG